MTDEKKIGPTGEFPEGKLTEHDEGALNIGIAADIEKRVVHIQFGKPVAWLAMEKSYALGLADSIRKKAEELP
jgi:hypothetical protein